jgi:hypothetical protein
MMMVCDSSSPFSVLEFSGGNDEVSERADADGIDPFWWAGNWMGAGG